jgi:hypothetical protein
MSDEDDLHLYLEAAEREPIRCRQVITRAIADGDARGGGLL